MTEDESGIMRDAYRYLNAYGEPVASDDYWQRAAQALAEAGQKWRQPPLAEKIFIGLYEYLEIKQKEMSR